MIPAAGVIARFLRWFWPSGYIRALYLPALEETGSTEMTNTLDFIPECWWFADVPEMTLTAVPPRMLVLQERTRVWCTWLLAVYPTLWCFSSLGDFFDLKIN